jgi:hypothetical protein
MPLAVHTGGGGVFPASYDGMAMAKLHLNDICLLPSCTKATTVFNRQENKLPSQQPVFRSTFEARTSKKEVRNITLKAHLNGLNLTLNMLR